MCFGCNRWNVCQTISVTNKIAHINFTTTRWNQCGHVFQLNAVDVPMFLALFLLSLSTSFYSLSMNVSGFPVDICVSSQACFRCFWYTTHSIATASVVTLNFVFGGFFLYCNGFCINGCIAWQYPWLNDSHHFCNDQQIACVLKLTTRVE